MVAEILIKTGTPIVVANAATHAPGATAANNLGADTGDQIDLIGVVSGEYRESTKLDFGATRARFWEATGAIEFASAPAAGGLIYLYIGWSNNATAGQDNPGGLSGTDKDYTGYGAAASDADEGISQLELIGFFAASANDAIQVGNFWQPRGLFTPRHRWGSIVVKNAASVALETTDSIEMSIRLSPVIDELQ